MQGLWSFALRIPCMEKEVHVMCNLSEGLVEEVTREVDVYKRQQPQ